MKIEEIEKQLNDKFGFFAILGGERFYNGRFDPSVGVREVAEYVEDLISTIKREVDTYSFSIHPDIAGIMESQGEAIITLDGKVYRVIEENKYSERLETIKREAVEEFAKWLQTKMNGNFEKRAIGFMRNQYFKDKP